MAARGVERDRRGVRRRTHQLVERPVVVEVPGVLDDRVVVAPPPARERDLPADRDGGARVRRQRRARRDVPVVDLDRAPLHPDGAVVVDDPDGDVMDARDRERHAHRRAGPVVEVAVVVEIPVCELTSAGRPAVGVDGHVGVAHRRAGTNGRVVRVEVRARHEVAARGRHVDGRGADRRRAVDREHPRPDLDRPGMREAHRGDRARRVVEVAVAVEVPFVAVAVGKSPIWSASKRTSWFTRGCDT